MSKPLQFRVGQKFEGRFTGAIREIISTDSYNLEYEVRYPSGRVTRFFGTKRGLREQIASGDLKEVGPDAVPTTDYQEVQ